MIATVTLGELQPAKKQSLDPRKSPDEQFELLSIPAFDAGAPEVVLGAEVGSSKQLVNPGDVMISKIVPHIRRAWVVPEARDGRQIASSEWIVHRSDRFDSHYLRHVLLSDRFHQSFMQTVAGVGGSLLRARPAYVAEIEIPLPPVEEQRRIAAILDEADALRVKRRQALAKLDALTQAIFIDMFGDPATNPKGWPDPRIENTLESLTYGHRFYDESYSENGTPVVRITDLDEAGNLDFESMPKMHLSEEDREKYRVSPGDILFARSGATVGKVALIRPGDPECIAGAYFVWMRFNESIDPEYARAVLTSDRIRQMIATKSKQSAQQNFSGPAIKRLPMPTPPLALQEDFVRVVGHVRAQSSVNRRDALSLDKLFASLQQRAFRGDL